MPRSPVMCWNMAQLRLRIPNLRRALSALLMLVLALAPFEARFMMAAHAGSHVDVGSARISTHDHTRHATGHHDQASHKRGIMHDHQSVQTAVHDATSTAPEHHGHSGGPDDACCGTFCHSACIEIAGLDIPNPMPTTVFERLVSAPLLAVVQGQLQRPPSRLLSI